MNGTIEMHRLIEAPLRKNAIEGCRPLLVALLDGHRQAMRGVVPDHESMQKKRRIGRARDERGKHRSKEQKANHMFHAAIFLTVGAGPYCSKEHHCARYGIRCIAYHHCSWRPTFKPCSLLASERQWPTELGNDESFARPFLNPCPQPISTSEPGKGGRKRYRAPLRGAPFEPRIRPIVSELLEASPSITVK